VRCEEWVFDVQARVPKSGKGNRQIRSPRDLDVSNLRRYGAIFKDSLSNSMGEAEETKVWPDFALDCGYLSARDHRRLTIGYDQVSAMLGTLMTRWETFS